MAAIVIPVNDVVEGNALLDGEEEVAFGDAGCRGVDKRADADADADAKVRWRIAMQAWLDKADPVDALDALDALVNKVQYLKVSARAKVGHPFRVIKREFGYVRVRYRGLKKSTAHLVTLFAQNVRILKSAIRQHIQNHVVQTILDLDVVAFAYITMARRATFASTAS